MEATRPRVLCVDDESMVLDGLKRSLRQHFTVVTASSGQAGLVELGEQEPFEVVVSDMRMPQMNGATFLRHCREQSPDTVRLLLTGQTDLEAAIAAVNEGHIFRFLSKPCPPDVLIPALQAAVEQHRLITSERVLLERTLRGSIQALTDTLALASPAGFGRANRIKHLVTAFSAHLDAPNDAWQLEVAAMLSQIGCITLPAATAEKLYHGRELDEGETEMVARLPATAEQILSNIPRLEAVLAMLKYQAKRFDGAGLPADGVRGPRLPWGARLLKIAIDYDVLETRGMAPPAALGELRGRSGTYDPDLLQSFAEMFGDTSRAAPFQEMRLADVRIGMVFAEDVTYSTGVLLIARGQAVTPALLTRIQNFSRGVGVREPVRMTLPDTAAEAADPERIAS